MGFVIPATGAQRPNAEGGPKGEREARVKLESIFSLAMGSKIKVDPSSAEGWPVLTERSEGVAAQRPNLSKGWDEGNRALALAPCF